MECFVQLVKVDEERRLIHGRAVQEVPDRAREILDYESAKPAFLEWSKACEDATAGLSKGNVRVMHGKSVAGKVVDMAFNDDEKAIDIVVKVVDDNEWRKCLEGCYAGFSVGGSYAKKWQDGEFTRYTPRVTEVSLVDRPCIPTAKFFSIHKADGSVEEREFALDDASRMTDADRLRAIAALAGGMMPNSPVAAMPVPEQMTDTRETAQPNPVDTSAVEKVAMFGDLYKADGRKGRDGDGDGKLNEGKASAVIGGALLGASVASTPEAVNVARCGLDAFHGAVLGFKTRNDVRDFKTRRLTDGPSSAPSSLHTALERTVGGAKAGVAAGKGMDAAAQKTFDEGVRAQSRMRIGPIAMAPGDGEKVRHAFAARSFMQSRAKGAKLAALLAGGAAGAGIGYAMSKTDPMLFNDLFKADWEESKHPRDDSGRFTHAGMGVAAVGGALIGGALTAAALRTGRGQAAMSAARASMGPITRAVHSVSKDTAAAWRVASKTAAGQFVGNQYKNFRSLPRLVQAGAVGTALAVTPGGDKLFGLVGLDPNAEWTNGGFRFSIKSKNTGANVFSQNVKLFNEDAPAAPQPQQQPYQRPPLTMPQPQQAARSYEQTGSIMGQPAARPAATQPAQTPATTPAQPQPAAPDARAAYSERPQINPRNEAYQRLKHGVNMAIEREAYFKGDGDLAWAKNVEQVDAAARKHNEINYAEAQDVVNKIRFSMWTKPSGAKGDYDDLKDHIEVRHSPGRDGKSDYEGESGDLYRKADRALVRYAPHLSRPQKEALYAFIDSKRIPPDYDMIKVATFGDLFKAWDEPAPLLFGDLFKADWEESKHPRDGDGQFADVPGKGNDSDPFHDGRGYSVAAKKRAHETAVKVARPDTKEYAEAYHKAMIQEDPKYRSEHTQVIEERRGRDVWPIMAAKATSWAAFGGGAALGAALPNKRVGQAAGALFGGMFGAARGAVGGVVNPTRSFKFAGRNVTIGGKDWASRIAAGAVGTAHGAVSGAFKGARAATRSTKWNRAANAGIAANAVGWGVYFGVQPPVHFLGNVNDAARGGARRVEK